MSTDNFRAAIVVERFWTQYTPNADGSLRAVDMCAYSPVGRRDRSVTVETVTRLLKTQPESFAANNPSVAMAWARRRVIEPAYQAWKAGQELPETGTALAAWPGISPEQAEALRMIGIKTLEAFAEASDGIVSKANFPNARGLQENARAFLKAHDRQKVAAEVTNLAAENAALKEQQEELRQIILDMQREAQEAKAKRGPGRPRKIEAESEDEAA